MLLGRFYSRIFSLLFLLLVFSNEVLARHKYDGPDMPALRAAAASGNIEQIDILLTRITDRVYRQQRIVTYDWLGRSETDSWKPRDLLDNTRDEFFEVIREAVRNNQVAASLHLVEIAGNALARLREYDSLEKYRLEAIQLETSWNAQIAIKEAFTNAQDEVLEALLVKHYQNPEHAFWHFNHDPVREVAFNAVLDPENFLRVFRLLLKHGVHPPWEWIASQHGSLKLVQACIDLVDDLYERRAERGDSKRDSDSASEKPINPEAQLQFLPKSLLATHRQVQRMRLSAERGDLNEFDDAWDALNAITFELARGPVLTKPVGYDFERVAVEDRPPTFQNSPVMLLGNKVAKRLAKKAKRSDANANLVAHVRHRLTKGTEQTVAHHLQTEYPRLQKAFVAAVTGGQWGQADLEGMNQAWTRIKQLGMGAVGETWAAEVFTSSLVSDALRKAFNIGGGDKNAISLIFELVRRDCPQHMPQITQMLIRETRRSEFMNPEIVEAIFTEYGIVPSCEDFEATVGCGFGSLYIHNGGTAWLHKRIGDMYQVFMRAGAPWSNDGKCNPLKEFEKNKHYPEASAAIMQRFIDHVNYWRAQQGSPYGARLPRPPEELMDLQQSLAEGG